MGQLGDLLRTAREEKGASLAQAEAATMIRRRYLEALEDDQPQLLPGAVYTKGFLRNYAIYLGLDPNHVLSLYHRQHPGEADDEVVVPQPTIRPRGTSQLLTGGTLGGLLLVVVLAIFAVYAFRQVQTFRHAGTAAAATPLPTPTSIPPTATPSPTGAAAVPTPALSPTPVVPLNAAALTATVSQDSWAQVQVDGKQAFEGILRAGQSETWTGKSDVFLWVGNAGGVSVTFNGQKMGPLGNAGQVVRKDFRRIG
ncbi:MAG TPA: RodZ domain-containing protein [Chloroflexota bacterium]|nr:RodZ domain-containing protein [Chloroflexota bacterium]